MKANVTNVSLSLFVAVALLGACGKSSKKAAEEVVPSNPPINQPTTETPPESEDADPIPLVVGEASTAKGDVLKDEEGIFSLTRMYSFSLTEKKSLQVRKSFANGNCGSPLGAFAILQGETQLADTFFDPTKDYQGVPTEAFAEAFEPGDYLLFVHVTLEQECKGMMFYYDFFLEEAK